MKKILVINTGSSSLKFSLFEMPSEKVVASGIVERIGMEDAVFKYKTEKEKTEKTLAIKDHFAALRLVADQLLDGLTAWRMAGARGAAVVFRNMDVVELASAEHRINAAHRVLLLDVRVEGVVHRPEVRVIHPLHIAGGLLHGVEQVAFKAVQRLNGKLDASLLAYGRDCTMHSRCMVQFRLTRELAGELAQHLVVRTAERLYSGIVAAFNHSLQVIDCALAMCRHRADGVVLLIRQHGHSSALQAIVLQHLAHRGKVGRTADVKDGNLNTVVASSLEFVEKVKVSVGDVTRPKEKIEADFHAEQGT